MLRKFIYTAVLTGQYSLGIFYPSLAFLILFLAAPILCLVLLEERLVNKILIILLFTLIYHLLGFYWLYEIIAESLHKPLLVNLVVFSLTILSTSFSWFLLVFYLHFVDKKLKKMNFLILSRSVLAALAFVAPYYLFKSISGGSTFSILLIQYEFIKDIVFSFSEKYIVVLFIFTNLFLAFTFIDLKEKKKRSVILNFCLIALLGLPLSFILYRCHSTRLTYRDKELPRIAFSSINSTKEDYQKLNSDNSNELTVSRLNKYLQLTKKLIKDKENAPDLIIWPEASYANYFDLDVENYIKEQLPGLNSYLALGAYSNKSTRANTNSIFFLPPATTNLSYQLYKKARQAPLGEKQLSIKNILGFNDSVNSTLEPLSKLDLIEIRAREKIYYLKPIICYESLFPIEFNEYKNADFIVMISNEEWLDSKIGKRLFYFASVLRALETKLPFCRVSNSGVTGFISGNGNEKIRNFTFEEKEVSDLF